MRGEQEGRMGDSRGEIGIRRTRGGREGRRVIGEQEGMRGEGGMKRRGKERNVIIAAERG